jgi:hypothetical protein
MIRKGRYALGRQAVKTAPRDRLILHLGPGPAARFIPLTQPTRATKRRMLRLCRHLAQHPAALAFGDRG